MHKTKKVVYLASDNSNKAFIKNLKIMLEDAQKTIDDLIKGSRLEWISFSPAQKGILVKFDYEPKAYTVANLLELQEIIEIDEKTK